MSHLIANLAPADTALTCQVIQPNHAYEGQQGLRYFTGVAAETTGAHGICMHLVRIPPGARANAHLHEQHETAISCCAAKQKCGTASGWSSTWWCAPMSS